MYVLCMHVCMYVCMSFGGAASSKNCTIYISSPTQASFMILVSRIGFLRAKLSYSTALHGFLWVTNSTLIYFFDIRGPDQIMKVMVEVKVEVSQGANALLARDASNGFSCSISKSAVKRK